MSAPWRRRIAWVVATWFGCGLVPVAPGTAGTLGAIPLYLAAARGGPMVVLVAAVLATFAGVWAATAVARDIGTKDPQVVVVDEVAGFLVTMIPVATVSWQSVGIGFLLFRVLDSLKPWPIRRFEALPAGWGIVMDDVAAGVLGAGAMALLRWFGVLT